MAPVVQDVGDPKPESQETLLSGSGPPEGRSLGKALPARGRGRTGVPRRGSWAPVSGRAVERAAPRERALHLRVLPAAAAPPAARACGVRPALSPAWEPERGGRTRLGPGAHNDRPLRPACPALAPID